MNTFARITLGAVMLATLIASSILQPGIVQAQSPVTITVNDLIARDLTEGDMGGLFGGKHDEPYFLIYPVIYKGPRKTIDEILDELEKELRLESSQGSLTKENKEARIIKVRGLRDGQNAKNIVLWQGILGGDENLALIAYLMEEDGSGLRDGIGVPLLVIGSILVGNVNILNWRCAEFGQCFNKDDQVGAFAITLTGSQLNFQGLRCAKISGNNLAHKRIDLTCNGHYELGVDVQSGPVSRPVGGTPIVRPGVARVSNVIEPDFIYNIVAQHSGKCLGLIDASQDNGAIVQQWDCLGPQQANQLWRLQQDGDGYNIIAVHSSKCLDLAAEQWESNGGKVQQWDCVGGGWTNQVWKLQPAGDVFQIISPSGRCLDVSEVSANNGATVWQWDCIGHQQTNQLWTLHKIP